MSFKEKILKILYFIPKMYFMLFNFMIDGETGKFIRFMNHIWTIIIICYLPMYLRVLILHMTGIEPTSNIIAFAIIGLVFAVIYVLGVKYVVIRLFGRGTFKRPVSADEKNSDNVNENSGERTKESSDEKIKE